MSDSLKKLAASLNTLRLFLKQYDKTVKFPALYPLHKPKQEIGFTSFKDELFAQFFEDIKEHCNRQIRLSFRFERNKECCFSIKKFQIVSEQNVLKKIINLRHCEVHSLYKNHYYIASKCGIFDSNCDISLKHSCSGTLPRPNTVELIGGVICSKKKSSGGKCVYLTSFRESNKNTYQCKKCKSCSHVLNIPFKYQKLCGTLLGWTYCLKKRQRPITKKGNSRLYCNSASPDQNSPRQKQRKLTMSLFRKKQRYYHIWNNSVTLLLVVFLQHKLYLLHFSNFSPTDNTLFHNQHNAIYSLQQRNTVDSGLWS